MTEEEEMLLDFKFKPDSNCQECLTLKVELVEREIRFEVVDKTEKKRLVRKGKDVPHRDSDDAEEFLEEVKEEESRDEKDKQKDKKKYDNHAPAKKGGKRYFMREKSIEEREKEEKEKETEK